MALSRDPQGTSRGPSRDPKMQIFSDFVTCFNSISEQKLFQTWMQKMMFLICFEHEI